MPSRAAGKWAKPPPIIYYNDDHTATIPDGCLALIFERLSYADRNACSLVCRRWLTVEAQNRRCVALNASARVTVHLPAIFTRFDSVVELALRCDRNSVISINDHALILISQRCRDLRRLNLRRCREVSSVGVLAVAQNCKSLRKFSCTSCTFGAKGMHALLSNASSLEELSIKRLLGIGDGEGAELITSASAAAATLKSIKLKKLHNAQRFATLLTQTLNLTTLKISSCSGNWDAFFHSIITTNNNNKNQNQNKNKNKNNFFTKIHLEKVEVSDAALISISKCSNLEVIHLSKAPDCSNEGISAIFKNCKLLKSIHIEGCRGGRIGDRGLMEIANNSHNLVRLALVGINPSSTSLIAIATNCKRLERLELSRSKTIGDEEISCMAASCRAPLKRLVIKRCRVTDRGIEAVARGCRELMEIRVEKCRGVTRGVVQLLRERRESLLVDLCVDEGEAQVRNARVYAILFVFTFYLILLLRNYLFS